MKKPRCKLPDIPQASHLIGLTISTLKEAGNAEKVKEFVNEIKDRDLNFDIDEVLKIAGRYVDFHDEEEF